VLLRDEVTLLNRYRRWFPAPAPSVPGPLPLDDHEALEEVTRLLDTVAEVVGMARAHPLEQRAEAIEMMERLLREAGMAPWRYAELLRRHAWRLERPLAAVHAAVENREAS